MSKKPTVQHKKRHGLHHKHTNRYLKTYLPYLPLVTAAIVVFISNLQLTSKHTVGVMVVGASLSSLIGFIL